MVNAVDRQTYKPCLDYYEQALNSEKGIRLKFSSKGDAIQYRLRLHAARRLDRSDNYDSYDTDHPLSGRSVYDGLVVKLRDGEDCTYLYIVKANEPEVEQVEDLDGIDQAPDRDSGAVDGNSPLQTIVQGIKRKV